MGSFAINGNKSCYKSRPIFICVKSKKGTELPTRLRNGRLSYLKKCKIIELPQRFNESCNTTRFRETFNITDNIFTKRSSFSRNTKKLTQKIRSQTGYKKLREPLNKKLIIQFSPFIEKNYATDTNSTTKTKPRTSPINVRKGKFATALKKLMHKNNKIIHPSKNLFITKYQTPGREVKINNILPNELICDHSNSIISFKKSVAPNQSYVNELIKKRKISPYRIAIEYNIRMSIKKQECYKQSMQNIPINFYVKKLCLRII